MRRSCSSGSGSDDSSFYSTVKHIGGWRQFEKWLRFRKAHTLLWVQEATSGLPHRSAPRVLLLPLSGEPRSESAPEKGSVISNPLLHTEWLGSGSASSFSPNSSPKVNTGQQTSAPWAGNQDQGRTWTHDRLLHGHSWNPLNWLHDSCKPAAKVIGRIGSNSWRLLQYNDFCRRIQKPG